MQCQKTEVKPQVYSSGVEGPENKPKYGDNLSYIQTACNILSTTEKQINVEVCNVNIVEQGAEKKEDQNGETNDPVHQEPVAVGYDQPEPGNVLSQEHANHLPDILNMGL